MVSCVRSLAHGPSETVHDGNLMVWAYCVLALSMILLYLCAPTGYVLGNLPVEKAGIISKEHVCEGMSAVGSLLCTPVVWI